ncbi:bifunctional folylpolyglutamate synthase/dihydrofolate synthase [Tichowtungia aerotolerans]|uniref:Dihydrofolate synthase/folylpolyglutamate synthase n=1 Tax=Tichowtungia aerotolerans TaxID=2697043 RepID=A0A6P1M9M8_9BACT|nr:folylpolyglutamate synthase/dihydrofolate synthase family protein [Tichowtungia aerotolerans]QHI70732.1 bifunctional folylpolyglutamate synthase/dihydrofolate synthase [Tichowtungia aerotolerans]
MNIEQLFARTALGIRPGLDVITALLDQLGNPQREFKSIHVAGTNGKGSVCAMIESVLRASGKKTGLYTSPHLIRFNERFRVNGQDIPNENLDQLIQAVEVADSKTGLRPATFFELSTAIAFEHFKRSGVEYAVIETGMGGRWDATNVIQPVVSVITRIALDHANYLGEDLEKIAWEKAGIIKEGVPVICGPMPVAAEAVVYKEAADKKVPILGSEEAAFFQVLDSRRTDQLVDIEASGTDYRNIRLPLGGSYQLENCGIAVAALEDLSDIEGLKLQMKKGLETVRWPGRFQMLSMKPPIIFDGGHNPNGAETLFQTLDEIFPKFGNGFVFGFMKDKDVAGILAALKPATEKAFAVTLPGERAMSAEEIAEVGQTIGMKLEPIEDLQPARNWVESGKKRLLCFTGSLYLAEELRRQGLFNG